MYLLRSQHEKPLSLEEIGQKYDLTRERVRQIRDITLYKLKKITQYLLVRLPKLSKFFSQSTKGRAVYLKLLSFLLLYCSNYCQKLSILAPLKIFIDLNLITHEQQLRKRIEGMD